MGGLGIRKISSVALPAFLASVHSTLTLIKKVIPDNDLHISFLQEAKSTWLSTCPDSNLPPCLESQRQWDEPLCKLVRNNLLHTSTSSAECARLNAVSRWESGQWLLALPSSNLGTLFDDTTLRLSICLRLGAPCCEPHRCPCGIQVDGFGHHGLSCVRSTGRIPRHASLNQIIHRALTTVNAHPVLEPTGLARDDGKRPDGMTLVPWKRGRSLVWDATCVDTLALSHLPATTVEAGAAAASAESLKRRKYAALEGSYIFAPFGVETLGPWGPGAHSLFNEIKERLLKTTGEPKAGAFLAQRLSIAIQRGNAASLLGTIPSGSDWKEIFFL